MHCTTPQTTYSVLINLEHHGFIVRSPYPDHGRIPLLQLTDDGHRVLQRAAGRVAEVDRRLTTCLTREERDTFLSLLNRCMASLPQRSDDDE